MKIDATAHPTPEALAQEWWDMNDQDQARFFNRLGRILEEHPVDFMMQLDAMARLGGLTLEGRRVLQAFHEYSHEGDRV